MHMNKYRFVKSIRYEDIKDYYEFIDTIEDKIFHFRQDNKIAKGDLITLDLRLFLEKSETSHLNEEAQ